MPQGVQVQVLSRARLILKFTVVWKGISSLYLEEQDLKRAAEPLLMELRP